MARRRRRKSRSAAKTWRYIKKQRRRRGKLHPTRRKQENFAILGAVASLPLLLFVGIPAAFAAVLGALASGVASKGSPPSKTVKHKNVKRESSSAMVKMSGRDALALKKRASTCSDACKYSTHDKSTCDCVCGGSSHGVWAWGPLKGKTTPNVRRPKRQVNRRRAKR